MLYDYIIAGAGLGGLSFVHQILKAQVPFEHILILDLDPKISNDRTWSFWAETTPDYQCAQHQVWDHLGFASDDYVKFEPLTSFKYYSIRGIDFYNEVKQSINADPRITFKSCRVEKIVEIENTVNVHTNDEIFNGRKVIDSITRPELKGQNLINVSQSFLGWVIETDQPSFDPKYPILMDFRVPQLDQTCFSYLLPFSQTRALVEYTQFTRDWKLDKELFRDQLHQYVHQVLNITKFEIVEEEVGQIPMTNFEFDSKPSPLVYRIGTAGGDTKSTTGYTFNNVQNHVKQILGITKNQVFQDNRFAFYDSLLLHIMATDPTRVKPIMEYLFKTQPISRVLKFLDEDTNLLEELMIFGQLPWTPFLRSLSTKVRHGLSL